jgi:hypothetical protein
MITNKMIQSALKDASIEKLMSIMDAIKEGRYHSTTAGPRIIREINRRVPRGCILVWKEKRARWSRS